jgi:hypothetical protein
VPALLDETGTGILDEALGAMFDESEAGTLATQFVSRATPLAGKTSTDWGIVICNAITPLDGLGRLSCYPPVRPDQIHRLGVFGGS